MISVSTPATNEIVRPKGLFDYISSTRLSTWIACPLRFRLLYADGIPEPTSRSLFLGRRVHDALKFVYDHLQAEHDVASDELHQHILATWNAAVEEERIEFESPDEQQRLLLQTVSLVQKYLEVRDDTEGFPIGVETAIECPLVDPITGEDLGVPLFGIVDLLLKTPTGYVIADFKTAAKSSAPLEIAHEIQLSCYAYAFRQIFGEREQEVQIRSLIKTKTPKVQTHRYAPRSDVHMRRLFAVIRAYLDDLHSGRYIYRPSWTCSMCSFRETDCRQWQG
jgi:CRISPR/Cas system-associated exonuclease Cas4 (RecB family)